MTNFKTLLLATAIGVAGLSGAANAGTVVSTNTDVMINGTHVAVPAARVGGRVVASDSQIAVGTRKVGMVGGRPYPIEKAHAETTTVRQTRNGLVARTEVSSTGVIDPANSGGNYYTETDGSFYADPAFDVNVYKTGSFNQ